MNQLMRYTLREAGYGYVPLWMCVAILEEGLVCAGPRSFYKDYNDVIYCYSGDRSQHKYLLLQPPEGAAL